LKSRYLSMRDEYIQRRKKELRLAGLLDMPGGPPKNVGADEKSYPYQSNTNEFVVNSDDIRSFMEHSLVGSFSRTMRALYAFIVNDTPTAPEPAKVQVVGATGNALQIDAVGDINAHVTGPFPDVPVPINIVQMGGSNVDQSFNPLNINIAGYHGQLSGPVPVDINQVGGTTTDQSGGRLGVDLRSVNGQTLSMQNNAIAVAVKDNTANRYATVSTSSSLQTVVSSTFGDETDPDSPVEVVKKKRSKSVSVSSVPMMGTVVSGVKK